MREYKLIVQSKAQQDVERIYDYIQYTLLNSQAAEAFVDCLEKRYQKISDNPYSFSVEIINGKKYRRAMVKRYVIIFRIDEQNHTANIIAVGHSKQRRKNILK